MVRRRVQRAERVRTRRQLGPLGKRRVAPSTNKLYDAALQLFSAWLRAEGKRLPRHEDHNIRTCRIYVDAALQDAAGLEEEATEGLKAGLKCFAAFFAGL